MFTDLKTAVSATREENLETIRRFIDQKHSETQKRMEVRSAGYTHGLSTLLNSSEEEGLTFAQEIVDSVKNKDTRYHPIPVLHPVTIKPVVVSSSPYPEGGKPTYGRGLINAKIKGKK